MHAEDFNDSVPNLPPASKQRRLKQGDRVVCIDNSDLREHLKLNKEYEIDADYGDVNGRQCVYLVGDSESCPYAASRFKLAPAHPDDFGYTAEGYKQALGSPAAEFAEIGMLAVKVPSPVETKQALLTGAAQKLSRTDQAVFENLMDAESRGAVPHDNVNLPAHYARFKIEPIRLICENGLNFFQGNIVKYTLRHDAKNGLEDIKKAIRYAQMYFKFLSGDPDWWKAVA